MQVKDGGCILRSVRCAIAVPPQRENSSGEQKTPRYAGRAIPGEECTQGVQLWSLSPLATRPNCINGVCSRQTPSTIPGKEYTYREFHCDRQIPWPPNPTVSTEYFPLQERCHSQFDFRVGNDATHKHTFKGTQSFLFPIIGFF